MPNATANLLRLGAHTHAPPDGSACYFFLPTRAAIAACSTLSSCARKFVQARLISADVINCGEIIGTPPTGSCRQVSRQISTNGGFAWWSLYANRMAVPGLHPSGIKLRSIWMHSVLPDGAIGLTPWGRTQLAIPAAAHTLALTKEPEGAAPLTRRSAAIGSYTFNVAIAIRLWWAGLRRWLEGTFRLGCWWVNYDVGAERDSNVMGVGGDGIAMVRADRLATLFWPLAKPFLSGAGETDTEVVSLWLILTIRA